MAVPSPPPMHSVARPRLPPRACRADRKSTRLNSSHLVISYAVFCLKKKNKQLHQVGSHPTSPQYVLSLVQRTPGRQIDTSVVDGVRVFWLHQFYVIIVSRMESDICC